MSKLSEEYNKIVKDLEKHISNEDEKKYVLEKITELTSLYLDIIDRITAMGSYKVESLEEEQSILESKINSMEKTLNLIKKDIYEDEDYDFEIVCPYCNNEFVASVEEELREEIECPKCHNIIELDWENKEDEDNCSGHNCEGCSGCNESNQELEDKEDKDNNSNEDDM